MRRSDDDNSLELFEYDDFDKGDKPFLFGEHDKVDAFSDFVASTVKLTCLFRLRIGIFEANFPFTAATGSGTPFVAAEDDDAKGHTESSISSIDAYDDPRLMIGGEKGVP